MAKVFCFTWSWCHQVSVNDAWSIGPVCQRYVPQETTEKGSVSMGNLKWSPDWTLLKSLTDILTPAATMTTEGQKAALSSKTCVVWAAVEGPSWSQLPEEYLSAGSKCSLWLSGPDVPLQTGTTSKGKCSVNTTIIRVHSKVEIGGCFDVYTLHSCCSGLGCNSVFLRWTPPLSMSAKQSRGEYFLLFKYIKF